MPGGRREERFFTFVNPGKVGSPNPGYCFKKAGWRHVGRTKKRGLHILEKTRPGDGRPRAKRQTPRRTAS